MNTEEALEICAEPNVWDQHIITLLGLGFQQCKDSDKAQFLKNLREWYSWFNYLLAESFIRKNTSRCRRPLMDKETFPVYDMLRHVIHRLENDINNDRGHEGSKDFSSQPVTLKSLAKLWRPLKLAGMVLVARLQFLHSETGCPIPEGNSPWERIIPDAVKAPTLPMFLEQRTEIQKLSDGYVRQMQREFSRHKEIFELIGEIQSNEVDNKKLIKNLGPSFLEKLRIKTKTISSKILSSCSHSILVHVIDGLTSRVLEYNNRRAPENQRLERFSSFIQRLIYLTLSIVGYIGSTADEEELSKFLQGEVNPSKGQIQSLPVDMTITKT